MSAKKLRGKIGEMPYEPHDNYNYENKEVGSTDNLVFKRGNESVSVLLSHPHIEKLEESSSNPHINGEWVHHGFDEKGNFYGHQQHTLWDKPYGRSKGAEITGLHATPGAKADVATAIGAAVEHSINRFGQIPKASSNLSEHSLPIVKRLSDVTKEKGIKGVDTPSRPNNDITKLFGAQEAKRNASWAFGIYRGQYKDIPDEKIESGSKLIRGLFAGRHLNKKQFEQPELPFGDK